MFVSLSLCLCQSCFLFISMANHPLALDLCISSVGCRNLIRCYITCHRLLLLSLSLSLSFSLSLPLSHSLPHTHTHTHTNTWTHRTHALMSNIYIIDLKSLYFTAYLLYVRCTFHAQPPNRVCAAKIWAKVFKEL